MQSGSIVYRGLIAMVAGAVMLGPMGAQQAGCPGNVGVLHLDSALRADLQESITVQPQGRRSRVALYATDLASGRDVGIDADMPVQTASVIKLGILYEAMEQVRAGTAHWDEPIVLKREDVVGGSGMLHFFDTPLTLTLKDVLTMMVIVSDNTATNLMVDRFGLDKINARMASLGLSNTHLYKKVFKPATGPMPADQPKFGLGKTTPREMATLMTTIGECRLDQQGMATSVGEARFGPTTEADKRLCGVALQMLKDQFYRETIARYLETPGRGVNGVAIANKTGSLDAVRNDVAIVMGKGGPMVLAIFTYDDQDHSWTVDNAAEVLIARLGQQIVETWSPPGADGVLLDGRQLVPGLGLAACPATAVNRGP